MSYWVNNHLNDLYVLSNKAIGPGKNSKMINVGPTSIPEARVVSMVCSRVQHYIYLDHSKKINKLPDFN